jgi:hypothetical protein
LFPVAINPRVVQGSRGHVSKIRLWFVQNRLKLFFLFFEFDSWKLSTDIGIWDVLFLIL